MTPWFKQYEQRFDDELQALTAAGYDFSVDDAEYTAGRLVLHVQYPLGEALHDLTVRFPDSYPYLPFEITSPTFPGGRHRDPYHGTLCLLQDPHQNWKTDDTLAGILKSQIGAIAQAHENPGEAEHLEVHEGAQATGYFPYVSESVLFTGDWSVPNQYTYGYMIVGRQTNNGPIKPLRGAVISLQDSNRKELATIDPQIARRYSNEFPARWVRLPAPPSSINGAEILQEAIKLWPGVETPRFKGGPDVVGLRFPEEVGYRKFEENWVFVVREKVRVSHGKAKIYTYFVRSDRATPDTLRTRIPRLGPLAGKRVLIVGLGAIGSICAWQLARAGIGGLNLLDFDHVQLGNAPRWLLGYSAVGYHKAGVSAAFLKEQNPFIDIRPFHHRVGNPIYGDNVKLDNEVLSEALKDVDLVLDATAEWCVSHYLSDKALQIDIPYLWVTGTPGSWGGVVGRVVPGRTGGCWKCFQRYLHDETYHLPAQEQVPDVQPIGCFHPTFPGSGFDMDHVALGGVRLAAATLCSDKVGGYPDFNWDVGIVDLWDSEKGVPIAPTWHTYELLRHPDCDAHD